MFVYQPTFSTFNLKENRGSKYLITWKSKGLFKNEHYLLHNEISTLVNIKKITFLSKSIILSVSKRIYKKIKYKKKI